MHRDDGSCAGRDQRFQLALVQVEGIRADIHEDRPGAAQDEGIDRGNKGEGGDDDLIAGLDVQQEGIISRAWVQEVVSRTFGTPNSSSSRVLHFFVNGPSPESFSPAMASAMYSFLCPP